MKNAHSNLLKQYKERAKFYKEKSKELDNQKFLAYLYIVFTLFAFSFFGMFAIRPAFTTISSLNAQYDESLAAYEAMKQKLVDLQELRAQYEQLENDLPRVLAALPNTPQVPLLARQIEALAQENSVRVTTLDFGSIELYPGTKRNDPLFSYGVNITAEGSEVDINNFIADLIRFERILSVERVTTGSTDRTGGVSQVLIGTRAYYFSN